MSFQIDLSFKLDKMVCKDHESDWTYLLEELLKCSCQIKGVFQLVGSAVELTLTCDGNVEKDYFITNIFPFAYQICASHIYSNRHDWTQGLELETLHGPNRAYRFEFRTNKRPPLAQPIKKVVKHASCVAVAVHD